MNGVEVVYIGEHTPWPSYVCVTRDRGYPESRRYYQRETCRVTREHVDIDGERMTDYSCGCFNQSGWGHNYCPNCGRKVVSE